MEIGLRKWDEGNGDRRLRMEDLRLRKLRFGVIGMENENDGMGWEMRMEKAE